MDEIGQKLRTARIEKGYTLDDLQQITKIQKRYLIAIEEGNFDALPGDFYVRAFIKQFADTVGLDSEALLTQFQQDIPDTQPQEYVEQSVENQSRKSRAAVSTPANKVRRYMPQIILVAIVVVIFAIVYGVTIANSHKSKPAIPNDSSSVTVSSQSKTKKASSKSSAKKSSSTSSSKASSSTSSGKSSSSSSSSSSKKKSTKKTTKKDANKLNVTVGADANSTQAVTVKNWPTTANTVTLAATSSTAWVSVIVNNATTWQGTLTAGASHTVSLPAGVTRFSVKSGNAKVTTIQLNKTKVDISKGSSIVRTINFTAESAGK